MKIYIPHFISECHHIPETHATGMEMEQEEEQVPWWLESYLACSRPTGHIKTGQRVTFCEQWRRTFLWGKHDQYQFAVRLIMPEVTGQAPAGNPTTGLEVQVHWQSESWPPWAWKPSKVTTIDTQSLLFQENVFTWHFLFRRYLMKEFYWKEFLSKHCHKVLM